MSIPANMGVPRFASHVRGTYNAGYNKEKIYAITAQTMPYMGAPRTLKALATVNEVLTNEPQNEAESENNNTENRNEQTDLD